jgi:hypothetical protein
MVAPTSSNSSRVETTPSPATHVGFDLSNPLPGHIDSVKRNVWTQLKGPTPEIARRLFGIFDFQPVIVNISWRLRFITLPDGRGGDRMHSVVANAVSKRMLSFLYGELERINRAKAQTTDSSISDGLKLAEEFCLFCIEASKANLGHENKVEFFIFNEFRKLENGSEDESIANVTALVKGAVQDGIETYRAILNPEARVYLDANFPPEEAAKEEEMDLGINYGEALALLDDAFKKQFPAARASGKLPITVEYFAELQGSVTKTHYDQALGQCWKLLFDQLVKLLPGRTLPLKSISDNSPSQASSSLEHTAWINQIKAALNNPDYAIALSKITSIDLTPYPMSIFPIEVAEALTGLKTVTVQRQL